MQAKKPLIDGIIDRLMDELQMQSMLETMVNKDGWLAKLLPCLQCFASDGSGGSKARRIWNKLVGM